MFFFSDCGYTCHEQCQDLVILDCQARLTPSSSTSEEQLFLAAKDDPDIDECDAQCPVEDEQLANSVGTPESEELSSLPSLQINDISEDNELPNKNNEDLPQSVPELHIEDEDKDDGGEKHEEEGQEKNEDSRTLKKPEVFVHGVLRPIKHSNLTHILVMSLCLVVLHIRII